MTKTVATSSVVSTDTPVTVPKRRGRKPNILKQQELEQKQQSEGLSSTESNIITSTTVGRKKKSNLKYSATSKKHTDLLASTKNPLELQENFEDCIDQQNVPLILHLNVNFDENHFSHPSNECFVSSKSYETNFYEYNPELKEPIAYEDHHSDKFQSTPENYKIIKHPSSNYNSTSIDKYFGMGNKLKQNTPKMIDDTLSNIDDIATVQKKGDKKCTHNSSTSSNIVLLKEMIMNEEWCENTNYWCYWDCHSFENKPFGIPIKYNNGKFHVYGCFCSMECAMAYNFYANENMDNVWENFNLLNMMSNVMSYKLSLNPAISRKCLNVFGGPLTIEQFREKSINNNKFNILTYPMVSIVEHVEEINESSSYDTKMTGFIPLDRSRVSKIEDTNRMNDSLIAKTKTVLEETMKLKFTY